MEKRTDEKICGRCRQALPVSSFAPSQAVLAGSWCRACMAAYRRERRQAGLDERTDRAATRCEACGASVVDRRKDARFCSEACVLRAYRSERPEKFRRWHLKSTYGITEEQRQAMFAEQGETCAICRTAEAKHWHVDHCHTTGAVRGILCSTCNHALGMFHDSTDKLAAAIAYLTRAATN